MLCARTFTDGFSYTSDHFDPLNAFNRKKSSLCFLKNSTLKFETISSGVLGKTTVLDVFIN
jgi:hypothetical protein